jgi:hypothetical protein
MFWSPRPRSGSPPRVLLLVTASVLASLLVFNLYVFFPHLPYHFRAFILRETPISACNIYDATTALAKTCPANYDAPAPRIPNIVNLVFVLRDPETSDYPIQFSHYLSIFALWWRLRPDVIYLHTNTGPDSAPVRRAKGGETGKWSRLFFAIPGLTVNEIAVPTRARNGVAIEKMEHKSDFVRVQAVHDFGGIYIDLDVHTLRDVKPLIESGYPAVVGRRRDSAMNSGTFMSEKGGRLISNWLETMHRVYDGRWVTHSNTALTRASEKMLREEPCEVLVMGQDAFAPVGWKIHDNDWLFDEHEEEQDHDEEVYHSDEDSLRRYDEDYTWDDAHPRPWARDWSCTYLLHAFNFKKPRHGFQSNGITPRYVLARRSNFARATYPIAKELLDRGVIAADEED